MAATIRGLDEYVRDGLLEPSSRTPPCPRVADGVLVVEELSPSVMWVPTLRKIQELRPWEPRGVGPMKLPTSSILCDGPVYLGKRAIKKANNGYIWR